MLCVIFGEHRPARLEFYKRHNEQYEGVPHCDRLLMGLGSRAYMHLSAMDTIPAEKYIDNISRAMPSMKAGKPLHWEFPEQLVGARDQIRIAEMLWKLHVEGCGVVLVTHSYSIVKWFGISVEYVQSGNALFVLCEQGVITESDLADSLLGGCDMNKVALELYDREVELS